MRKRILLLLIVLTVSAVVLWQVRNLRNDSAVSPTGRLNLLVYHPQKVWLLILDRESTKAVTVPGDVKIDASGGAGEYEVGKLRSLGEIEGEREEFVRDSFLFFLQIPIDAVLFPQAELTEDGLAELISIEDFLNWGMGDLTEWDRFVVWRRLRSNPLAGSQVVNLKETRAVEEVEEADGRTVFVARRELLPLKLERFFIEPEIAEKKLTAVVYNTTDKRGVGQLIAGIGERLGIDVFRVDNLEGYSTDMCTIEVGLENINSSGVKRLRQALDCKLVERQGAGAGEAVIEMYVGRGLAERI